MSKEKQPLTQQEQLVQGTAWLTAGNFISRLLGALYIIPWYAWMGQYAPQANALFGMGYEIYALFLLISTVGIPIAVAKQIAKYNTLDQMDLSFYLVRKVLQFMLILGLIFATLMYGLAPLFSEMSGSGQELIPVMRSLTLAVLVFPAMSVLRGFFQGFNKLYPSAVSQVAEQLIRVIWMLLTAFFIMKMGSGDYVEAVTQSTFAAFIGMLASFAVLFYFLWREHLLTPLFTAQPTHLTVSTKDLLWETIKEAIPFIVMGSAIQIFRLIDQVTYINAMSYFTDYSNEDLKVQFAYFASNPGKLTMIIVAVASSISATSIPLLTESFIKKNRKETAGLVINNIVILMLFIFPAIIGAIVLAEPLYTVFYGQSDALSLGLFVASLLQTVILSLYTVLSPILQAFFETRRSIMYFVYGLLVKIALQLPFIYLFHAYGPIWSTAVGLLVPIVLSYYRIQNVTSFNRQLVMKQISLIQLLTLGMFLVIAPVTIALYLFFPPASRWSSLLYVVLVGSLGVAVYGYLALKTRLLDKMIGKKAENLRQKMKIN
ncbi:putative polysaccharide biosynthesis protein [Streptococcus cuniculipharyngis]|uniref:Polysaccharide biosynthesis protein n=1 Tax=Streptococcus cuniculipharyngis TaxID=1562651 RepID=A0A5C5SB55_9STRE|nr:polysaccharide biosynthesis protein [Streptococcus cuniculipharyngis]TWS96654.1 polysaccharide biosynthesis protein [Streptococcus cuniculipharyngis]